MNYLALVRLCCLFGILLLSIAIQSHNIISGDITWLLHVGARLLAGEHYYYDFIEVNPPMAIYIYLIPTIASSLLSISFITSVTFYIYIVAIISWFCCNFLLQQIFATAPKLYQTLLAITLAFSYFLLPAYAFGQREYLFVLLIMPYLLLMALQLQQGVIKSLAAGLIGIAAGIGFVIKPYFLLCWLLLELYRLFKTRSISNWYCFATVACFSIFVLYGVSILYFTPTYIIEIIKIVRPIYYLNYHVDSKTLLLNNLVVLSGLILLLYGVTRKQLTYQVLADILAIDLVGSLISYILQQTIWYYHFLPALMFGTLLLALITMEYFYKKNLFKLTVINWQFFSKACTLWGLSVLGAWLIINVIINIQVEFNYSKIFFADPLLKFSQKLQGKSIYLFTNNIAANYPLIDYTGTATPARLPCLWPITAAVKLANSAHTSNQRNTAATIINHTRGLEVKAIIAAKPVYIFLQLSDRINHIQQKKLSTTTFIIEKKSAFNFLPLFLQDKQFAQFWQQYQYQGTVGDFAAYQLKAHA